MRSCKKNASYFLMLLSLFLLLSRDQIFIVIEKRLLIVAVETRNCSTASKISSKTKTNLSRASHMMTCVCVHGYFEMLMLGNQIQPYIFVY